MGDSSNLCLNCHQGRASGNSVNSRVTGGPGPYGFINVHYFAAAATLFGTEAEVDTSSPARLMPDGGSIPTTTAGSTPVWTAT